MTTCPENRLVGITGGSGSGKGWVAERLNRLLGEQACALSMDRFYRDRLPAAGRRTASPNFDAPDAIDWEVAEKALRDCRAGRPAHLPDYDFRSHRRLPVRAAWQPKPVVLVEGLSLLARAPVRQLFDLTIYLDCPQELRLSRRLARDVAERGRSPESVVRQFRCTVAPMHARHVEPQQEWADLVLTQPFRKAEVLRLAERLWVLFTARFPLQAWLRVPFQHELLTLLECHDHHP